MHQPHAHHFSLCYTLKCVYSPLHPVDEAPDTGDDSDDDLITNYLGGGHPGGNGAGGGAIPSIHLTSSQASNTNHILGKAETPSSNLCSFA